MFWPAASFLNSKSVPPGPHGAISSGSNMGLRTSRKSSAFSPWFPPSKTLKGGCALGLAPSQDIVHGVPLRRYGGAQRQGGWERAGRQIPVNSR